MRKRNKLCNKNKSKFPKATNVVIKNSNKCNNVTNVQEMHAVNAVINS